MVRGGFDPIEPFWYSRDGIDHKKNSLPFYDEKLMLPNLAGHLHFAIRTFIEARGLGDRCLLVSESRKVAMAYSSVYSDTSFLSCDLFSELQEAAYGDDGRPDFVWDVTTPLQSSDTFNSAIAFALLEHVIDPIMAIRNMLECLEKTGYLYIMTHSPSFHIHRYPCDYIRFNKDFWLDLPAYLKRSYDLEVNLSDLYWYDGVWCVAYQRH